MMVGGGEMFLMTKLRNEQIELCGGAFDGADM